MKYWFFQILLIVNSIYYYFLFTISVEVFLTTYFYIIFCIYIHESHICGFNQLQIENISGENEVKEVDPGIVSLVLEPEAQWQVTGGLQSPRERERNLHALNDKLLACPVHKCVPQASCNHCRQAVGFRNQHLLIEEGPTNSNMSCQKFVPWKKAQVPTRKD